MKENEMKIELKDNENIIKTIEDYAKENEIQNALFLNAKGKIKDYEIISIESKGSIGKTRLKTEQEIKAVSGKIEKTKDGKFNIYLRISLNSTLTKNNSGQLTDGKASGPLEIEIKKVDHKKMIIG